MKNFREINHMGKFRAGSSPVHRLSAGYKMLLIVFLSIAAFTARNPPLLAMLFFINIGYYFLAGLSLKDLWRDIRFFLLQMSIVLILYIIKNGIHDGFWPGLSTGLQILLFFLPSIVFIRTTQASQMMSSLQKIMPKEMAFFTFTSFRFLPFFAREIREIAAAQRLRGARVEPGDLVKPWNWAGTFHCIMIPLIVKAFKTAKEAALSAEARGFGATDDNELNIPDHDKTRTKIP